MPNLFDKCIISFPITQAILFSYVNYNCLYLAIFIQNHGVKHIMLNIGDRIIQLRKRDNLSQSGLADKIGASRTIVGNYERNINAPSIDMLVRIAKVFNVSVDYLVGEGQSAHFDKEVLKRIEDIERLDHDTREKLFFLIDNVIQNFKTKQAFS